VRDSIEMRIGGDFNIKQDPISISLIMLSLLVGSAIGVLAEETGFALDGQMISIMLIGGLIFGIMLKMNENNVDIVDVSLTKDDLRKIFTFAVLGLGGVAMSQLVAGVLSSGLGLSSLTATLNDSLFYASVGFAEEIFFRYAVLLAFIHFGFGMYGSVAGVSLLFSLYHLGVYGTMPSALVAMFLGSVVLCTITIYSERISPAMIAHGTWNFLVVLLGVF